MLGPLKLSAKIIFLSFDTHIISLWCMIWPPDPKIHRKSTYAALWQGGTYADFTTAVFGLCTHKWGIFVLVGDPLQSHIREFWITRSFSSPKIYIRWGTSVFDFVVFPFELPADCVAGAVQELLWQKTKSIKSDFGTVCNNIFLHYIFEIKSGLFEIQLQMSLDLNNLKREFFLNRCYSLLSFNGPQHCVWDFVIHLYNQFVVMT